MKDEKRLQVFFSALLHMETNGICGGILSHQLVPDDFEIAFSPAYLENDRLFVHTGTPSFST